MIRKKFEIKISYDNMVYILGNDKNFLPKIIKNVYCSNCRDHYNSEIVDYEIFINDLYDLILKGKCKKCGGRVGRYVETGEDEYHVNRAKEILKNKIPSKT